MAFRSARAVNPGHVSKQNGWLKVNEFGLMSLGKSDGIVKAISAVLDMSEALLLPDQVRPTPKAWPRH